MYANKTDEKKSLPILVASSARQRSKASVFQFKDNRPKGIIDTYNGAVIQRKVTINNAEPGNEVKDELGTIFILKEWVGRGWFLEPKEGKSREEVFRNPEDLNLVGGFESQSKIQPSTKRADTKDDGKAKSMTLEGGSSPEDEDFFGSSSSSEEDEYEKSKIPKSSLESIKMKPLHWESIIDKLTFMVDSQREKLEKPSKPVKQKKRERKDKDEVDEEKLINENDHWITERDIQLTELSTELDDAYDVRDRNKSRTINLEIERITTLLNMRLDLLYERWGIPGVAIEGDRSPRVFPDAEGTLYYFGKLPAKIRAQFEGVTYKELDSNNFIEQHKEDSNYTYPVSYGINNVIYTTEKIDDTKGSVLRQGSGKGDSYNKADKKKYVAIANNVDKLKLPNKKQNEIYVGPARRRSRAPGQFAEMNNTNAAAYAYGKGLDDKLEKKWEWLHIRGAGLGGFTKPYNLIVGTYSANSHMIPYENQIKTMSAYANSKQKLFVQWQLTKGKYNFSGNLITITLWAPDGLYDKRKEKNIDSIPKDQAWSVGFNPQRSVVFDKFLRHASWLKYKQHTHVKK